MSRNSLQRLLTDDFLASIGVVSNPSALRRTLLKNEHVIELRQAMTLSKTSERSVREFCDLLYRDFERGAQFPHELALAAVAVILEDRRTEFAEEYLLDLARLNIQEMSLAPRVARECYAHWRSLPRVRLVRKAFNPSRSRASGCKWVVAPFVILQNRRSPISSAWKVFQFAERFEWKNATS